MFTSIDKAIVAAIMAGVYIIYQVTGIDLGITEGTAASIAMIISTFVVWLVPNRA